MRLLARRSKLRSSTPRLTCGRSTRASQFPKAWWSSLAAADRVVGRRVYGGVLIVRAQIGRFTADLMVDTGCVVTSLTPRAVDRMRMDRRHFTGQRVVFTAAGTFMAMPIGRLDSLRLGGTKLRNVE